MHDKPIASVGGERKASRRTGLELQQKKQKGRPLGRP